MTKNNKGRQVYNSAAVVMKSFRINSDSLNGRKVTLYVCGVHTQIANQFSSYKYIFVCAYCATKCWTGKKNARGCSVCNSCVLSGWIKSWKCWCRYCHPPYHPCTFIQMCRKRQGGADISSLVNLLMQWEIGGPVGKGQSNINLTCR